MLCPLDDQPCTAVDACGVHGCVGSPRRKSQPWSGRTLAQVVDFPPCNTSRIGQRIDAFCSECGYSFVAHDKDNICRLPRKPTQ